MEEATFDEEAQKCTYVSEDGEITYVVSGEGEKRAIMLGL